MHSRKRGRARCCGRDLPSSKPEPGARPNMPGEVMRIHRFEYRNRPFEVRIGDDHAVELRLGGVVRKRRLPSGKAPMYLWTNVELQWEEHHFVEVRFWPASGRLLIAVNGDPIHDEALPASGSAG